MIPALIYVPVLLLSLGVIEYRQAHKHDAYEARMEDKRASQKADREYRKNQPQGLAAPGVKLVDLPLDVTPTPEPTETASEGEVTPTPTPTPEVTPEPEIPDACMKLVFVNQGVGAHVFRRSYFVNICDIPTPEPEPMATAKEEM